MPIPRKAARWLPLAAALLACNTLAQGLQGTRTLALHTADARVLPIGTVSFTPAEGGRYGFSIQLRHEAFSDHFLSMKEFKCVGGGPELMCHVPYPYPRGQTVSDTDFAWLEHALLFMFKRPTDFGAKLWNGVYFKLQRTPAGLRGLPQAVDLNHISAPPADTSVPPFKPALRDDYAPRSRWVQALSIE